MRLLQPVICLLIVLFFVLPARADVRAASPFGHHMVLQQGRPVPVWGTAAPGEQVMVTFGAHSAKTAADATGRWMVRLKALKASATPATLVITGTNTLTFTDVLVGEVWLCSGQSNMEWSLANTKNAAQEIAAAERPLLRTFTVAHVGALTPQTTCQGAWTVCSPKTAGSFSAVGYYFGRELQTTLGVPIGLINASYGGTRAEPWTSLPGLKALPSFRRLAEGFEHALQTEKDQLARERDGAFKAYADRRAAWTRSIDAIDPGMQRRWMAPGTDTSDWRRLEAPLPKQNNALGSFVGSLWCRKEVEIPASWVGKPLEVHLGVIDETDDTYVNGVHVGRTWFENPECWKVSRVYAVPASAVTSTRVSLTVRMLNLYFDLGFFGPAEAMRLVCTAAPADPPVSLAGHWRYTDGVVITDRKTLQPPLSTPPTNSIGNPAALFNGMINPLIPYAIRGAIWYQGESNAAADAYPEYRELFSGLITSWRQAWGQGDFPFAFVQLANYLAPQRLPVEKASWAEVRQAQRETLALRNTSMAVIIDIGEEKNIHPGNKHDVGRRLALGVLAKTYRQRIPLIAGPTYASLRVDGSRLRVRFRDAQGLKCKGERPTGFAIAGADRIFHFAQARLDGESVLVWSDQVPHPVAVRYGWANNPPCNLYNGVDLPAGPFRTDRWADFGVARQ